MMAEGKGQTNSLSQVHHVEEMRPPALGAESQSYVADAESPPRLNLRGIFVMTVSDYGFFRAFRG